MAVFRNKKILEYYMVWLQLLWNNFAVEIWHIDFIILDFENSVEIFL